VAVRWLNNHRCGEGEVVTAQHVFIVLTDPTPGLEHEYNDWYDNTHLAEVVATKGFVAAQRFRFVGAGVVGTDDDPAPCSYLAIYEVEGDLAEAQSALYDGHKWREPTPEALGTDQKVWWFTAVGEQVRSAADGAGDAARGGSLPVPELRHPETPHGSNAR
jgi:hypothetical protein